MNVPTRHCQTGHHLSPSFGRYVDAIIKNDPTIKNEHSVEQFYTFVLTLLVYIILTRRVSTFTIVISVVPTCVYIALPKQSIMTILLTTKQIAFDEHVDVAVEHAECVGCFGIGPVIFYHSIRVQYIRPYLATPLDFLFLR